MSLIQDALKRQQEEMKKKGSSAAPAPTPPPADSGKPLATASPGKLETPTLAPLPPIQTPSPLRMMGQPQSPPLAPPVPPKTFQPSAPAPAPIPPVAAPEPVAPQPAPKKVTAPEPVRPAAEAKPAPQPETNQPDEPRRNHRALTAVVIVLLVFGTAAYLFWPALSSHFRKTLPDLSIGTPELDSTTAVPAAMAPSADTTRPAAPITGAVVRTQPAEVAPEAVDTNIAIALLPAPAPNPQSDSTSTGQPPVAATVTAAPPVSLPEVPRPVLPPAEPVKWPPIKVTGFVKLGNTSAALINGKVLSAGETIENVLLVSITKDGALVRCQGEERILRVGETAR